MVYLPPLTRGDQFKGYKTCIPQLDEELPLLPSGSVVLLLGSPIEYPEILALYIARTCTPTIQFTRTSLIIPHESLNVYLRLLERGGTPPDMVSYLMTQDSLRIFTHDSIDYAVELARSDTPSGEPWIRIVDIRGTGNLERRHMRFLHDTRGLNLLIPGKKVDEDLYMMSEAVIELASTAAGNVEMSLVYSGIRPGARARLYYKIAAASVLFSMESRI